MAMEKTLESPLDCEEIQPVHPKGNQFWIFTGRTDAETGTAILWPPDAKNWLIGKDPDAGKDWRREEKGMAEDEMVGWHHWLSGHEFEQAPGVGDGQWSLACCSPWGHKELDTTERLNWTELGTLAYCAGFLTTCLVILDKSFNFSRPQFRYLLIEWVACKDLRDPFQYSIPICFSSSLESEFVESRDTLCLVHRFIPTMGTCGIELSGRPAKPCGMHLNYSGSVCCRFFLHQLISTFPSFFGFCGIPTE